MRRLVRATHPAGYEHLKLCRVRAWPPTGVHRSIRRWSGGQDRYGVMAIATGPEPTLIARPAVLVMILIGVTDPELLLAT